MNKEPTSFQIRQLQRCLENLGFPSSTASIVAVHHFDAASEAVVQYVEAAQTLSFLKKFYEIESE